jgi:hypothetical protein
MRWKEYPAGFVNGALVQAPLSGSGDYTISHRRENYTLSFRPTGGHYGLGSFPTLREAKDAAEKHAKGNDDGSE